MLQQLLQPIAERGYGSALLGRIMQFVTLEKGLIAGGMLLALGIGLAVLAPGSVCAAASRQTLEP